jgi:hypothetical protein
MNEPAFQIDTSGETADLLLTALQVRLRYGDVSDMWLFRMVRDDPNFPRPLMIRHKRYWRLQELLAYENTKRQGARHATA